MLSLDTFLLVNWNGAWNISIRCDWNFNQFSKIFIRYLSNKSLRWMLMKYLMNIFRNSERIEIWRCHNVGVADVDAVFLYLWREGQRSSTSSWLPSHWNQTVHFPRYQNTIRTDQQRRFVTCIHPRWKPFDWYFQFLNDLIQYLKNSTNRLWACDVLDGGQTWNSLPST